MWTNEHYSIRSTLYARTTSSRGTTHHCTFVNMYPREANGWTDRQTIGQIEIRYTRHCTQCGQVVEAAWAQVSRERKRTAQVHAPSTSEARGLLCIPFAINICSSSSTSSSAPFPPLLLPRDIDVADVSGWWACAWYLLRTLRR